MKGKTKYIRESFRLYLPPAVGYNYPLLMKMLYTEGVDAGYAGRALVISLISLIGMPFRLYEKLAFDKKASRVQMDEAPVFILGHWRSGTTYLHNILCQDPKAGYVTTYQSVFPDQTLTPGARLLFRNIMKMLIPINRKGDNVKLGTDYPQEEEFALAARNPACYYLYWYFPDLMLKYYDEFLTFSHSDEKTLNDFKKDYHRVINKALLYSGKSRFLSKNPVNTGRIPILLDMFPNARFIHIHRNPAEVILSTRNFYEKMMPGLTLHKIDFDKVNQDIYEVYGQLMRRYLDTRDLIPEGNLIEISYDELTSNPMGVMENIYKDFGLPNFHHVGKAMQKYVDIKKGYVRNSYEIHPELLREILSHVGFAMKEWGYELPDVPVSKG
jgi:omega-hydroxy-beta-dihydromenaquinone-9 sulfotransferase